MINNNDNKAIRTPDAKNQQQGPERACEEGSATLTELLVVESSVVSASFIPATIRGTISLYIAYQRGKGQVQQQRTLPGHKKPL